VNAIALGKNGDVISILPILYRDSKLTGVKSIVVTSEKFRSIFEGVSYCETVVYPGAWGDLHGAIKFAKTNYDEVVILQCHGERFPFAQTQRSFQQEVYQRAGLLNEWDNLELVFDQRDLKCEKELISNTVPRKAAAGRPYDKFILLGDGGQSAPFPQVEELFTMLQTSFGETHKIIRLSTVKAERIYDLIGLYDRAACLVTTDTVHLHLAKASTVPIIALARDGWVGASPSKRFMLYANYSQWDAIKAKLIGAVGAAISK
jgi:hypothetical protein